MRQTVRERWRSIDDFVWGTGEDAWPLRKRRGLRLLRTVLILARDLAAGQLTLRAMSLVYTTLLSIVPLLALSFSVLKAFGVHNSIQPMLLNFLEPLGDKGVQITENIVAFISNMNVGVLGAMGLGLLIYTAVSLMQKIEESLNFIWHIPRPRRLGERFSRYLSVLMVGPILVFSALGITATILNLEAVRDLLSIGVLGHAVKAFGELVPYLLVIAAFSFVYLFIPNARVRPWAALVGGAAGGIVWQTAGWAFAAFVASSGKYAAIYSGLAILVLFMIWLYLSWLILLFGASVAFYAQHPEYLYARGGEPRLSNRMRERLALSVMSVAATRFALGERMPTAAQFSARLGVPAHALQIVLDALESAGLLAQSGEDPPVYLLARDPAGTPLTRVLDTVRAAGEDRYLSPGGLPAPGEVDALLARVQSALEASLEAKTVRDLATLPAAPGESGGARP